MQVVSGGTLPLPGLMVDSNSSAAQAEQGLRQEALACLVQIMEAMWAWYRWVVGLGVVGGGAGGGADRWREWGGGGGQGWRMGEGEGNVDLVQWGWREGGGRCAG